MLIAHLIWQDKEDDIESSLMLIAHLICQDKEDDMKVGVKSTALRFGNATKPWLAVFGTGCVTCLTLAGFNCDLGKPLGYHSFGFHGRA